MNTKIEDINETRKALIVNVGADEVENERQDLIREFSKVARIPGFRPGKAPAAMVARRFSKEISKELEERLVSNAYEAGLKENDLTPAQIIEAPDPDFDSGDDLELRFVLDIHPEFNLPEYKGLSVVQKPEEADDEDVEKVIQTLREQQASFEKVDREAQKGDYVKVSYEGKIEEEAIADLVEDRPIYGKQSNTWEEAGSDQTPIPGLAVALQGMKAGDQKEIDVTFSEEESVEALKGKTAKYSLEVHEVRERKIPELDETFLESLGFEAEEELKKAVREDVERQKKEENRQAKREQITEQLLDAIEFPLPESLVDRETNSIVHQIVTNQVRQGVTQDQLEEKEEDLFNEAGRVARNRVKANLILGRIAEKEEIEVDESDLSRYIYFEAQRRRESPDQFVRELKKNPEQVQEIRFALMLDKTLEFLVENATVSDAPSEATNK